MAADQNTPARNATPIPWFTGLAVIACLGFSIHAKLQQEVVTAEASQALDTAVEYWTQHPYLEPGSVLLTRIDRAWLERARDDYEQRRAQQGWTDTPPAILLRRQKILDDHVATGLRGVRALPAQGVAVVPDDGPAPSWLLHPGLHPSLAFLAGNAFLLIFLGLYLERSLGPALYLTSLAGITAAGAAAWCFAFEEVVGWGLVGTAPLCAGLLAAFAVRYADRARDGFYPVGLVLGTAWLVLPPWLGSDASFTSVDVLTKTAAPASTDVYWALLGAAVAGVTFAIVARFAKVDGVRTEVSGSVAMRHPLFRRALRAQEGGRPREALELLEELVREEPDHYEGAVLLSDLLRELGRPEAPSALLHVIRIELKQHHATSAIDHWRELTQHGIPGEIKPAFLVSMALLLRENKEQEAAITALRCALERSDDSVSRHVAARIARAARGIDHEVAEVAAWRALGSIELGLRERQALESLLAEVLPARKEEVARAATVAPPTPAASAPDAETGEAAAPRPAPMNDAIDLDLPDRGIDAILAVPVELRDEGLQIQTAEGQKKLVRFDRMEAIAVAAVSELGQKPVILVDVVLNWMTTANETLRVIRLRADRFDPLRLVEAPSRVDALRETVKRMLAASGALPLPDEHAALGRPFASFSDLETYHRTVLMVESETASD
ncbi:MAG: hypothetical protein AAF430_10975 [Myxococcota bacterium]